MINNKIPIWKRHNQLKKSGSKVGKSLFYIFILVILLVPTLSVISAEKEPIHEFGGPGYDVHSVAISPDGNYFTYVKDSNTRIIKIDGENAEQIWSSDNGSNSHWNVAYSNNSKYLVVGYRSRTNLYTSDGKILVQQYKVGSNFVSISDNGSYIALCHNSDSDHEVHLYSKENSEPLWVFEDKNPISGSGMSMDGKYIASWNKKGILHLFERNSNIPLWNFTAEDKYLSVVLSGDGSYIVAANYDGNLYLFDKDSSTPLWNYSIGQEVHSVAISDDGSYVVCGGEDNSVYLFARNRTLLWKYETEYSVYRIVLSSQGNFIAVGTGGYNNSKIFFFERDSKIPIWNYTNKESIRALDISKSGEYIVSNGKYGYALLFKNEVPEDDSPLIENNQIFDILLWNYGPLPIIGYLVILLAVMIIGVGGAKRRKSKKKKKAGEPAPPTQPQEQQPSAFPQQQPSPQQQIQQPQQSPPSQMQVPDIFPQTQQTKQSSPQQQEIQQLPQQSYNQNQQFQQMQQPQTPSQQQQNPQQFSQNHKSFPSPQNRTPAPPADGSGMQSQSQAAHLGWQCPQCGNQVKQKHVFCTECGFKRQ